MIVSNPDDPYAAVRRARRQRNPLIPSGKVTIRRTRTGEWGTYECSHRSRYRSMNGSNDPRFSTNTFHIASNFAMRMAAVRSIVGACASEGRWLASDAIGGGLRRFMPQPVTVVGDLISSRAFLHSPITMSTKLPSKVVYTNIPATLVVLCSPLFRTTYTSFGHLILTLLPCSPSTPGSLQASTIASAARY